ncbi:MAG: 2-dehydropantoate 2-reductase [Gammaproteobacteria bacterium]|nr:2-dehydropantoate 2-reductase [Gammaproteobacteria bacterium]
MKIVVMGVGAMGSIYAALLADAGHEVWAIDVWKDHIEAIRDQGLRVEGASGDRVVQLNAATDVSEVGICDLVIIATKASGVGTAAAAAQAVVGTHTVLLTIQNGLGSGERIARYYQGDNVLLGVAQGFGASIEAPGHARHTSMSLIRIGAMASAENSAVQATVDRITGMWRDAGFNASSYSDIDQLIWEKFICNVAYSGPCTALNCTVEQLLANPDAVALSRQCAIEAFQVAKAKGINLSFEDPVTYVTEFGQKLGPSRPSMLLDHLARRPSEIDAINGMVPVLASELGVSAPCNDALSRLLRAREALWESPA